MILFLVKDTIYRVGKRKLTSNISPGWRGVGGGSGNDPHPNIWKYFISQSEVKKKGLTLCLGLKTPFFQLKPSKRSKSKK